MQPIERASFAGNAATTAGWRVADAGQEMVHGQRSTGCPGIGWLQPGRDEVDLECHVRQVVAYFLRHPVTKSRISAGPRPDSAPTTTQCRARGSRVGMVASSGFATVSSS